MQKKNNKEIDEVQEVQESHKAFAERLKKERLLKEIFRSEDGHWFTKEEYAKEHEKRMKVKYQKY